MGACAKADNRASLWRFLDMPDEALERQDIIEINLAVACGVPSLAELRVSAYCAKVDEWAERFRAWLPQAEVRFHQTPWQWRNDINFFRVGMLAGYLGHKVGIQYIPEQKHAKSVYYTNPSQQFVNGLIDTLKGTCASMPVLHVAIARRLGWPVSLTCIKGHFLSRFDDGRTSHNIEVTDMDRGGFGSGTDNDYLRMFNVPRKAIECGSDLRKLTFREVIGAFLALRARHFRDSSDWDKADRDWCLSRAFFPSYRHGYIGAMVPMIRRGESLFLEGENPGDPGMLFARREPLPVTTLFGAEGELSGGIVAQLDWRHNR